MEVVYRPSFAPNSPGRVFGFTLPPPKFASSAPADRGVKNPAPYGVFTWDGAQGTRIPFALLALGANAALSVVSILLYTATSIPMIHPYRSYLPFSEWFAGRRRRTYREIINRQQAIKNQACAQVRALTIRELLARVVSNAAIAFAWAMYSAQDYIWARRLQKMLLRCGRAFSTDALDLIDAAREGNTVLRASKDGGCLDASLERIQREINLAQDKVSAYLMDQTSRGDEVLDESGKAWRIVQQLQFSKEMSWSAVLISVDFARFYTWALWKRLVWSFGLP